MYHSIEKNTYPKKWRSDDLEHSTGGYIMCSTATESLDLPKSIYLTKGNFGEKKFSIRVDLPSKYIEIPLSMMQLNEWFSKIAVEDERERTTEKAELDAERELAIEIGEYDIGQAKGELNWLNMENNDQEWIDDSKTEPMCGLSFSTY